MMSTRRSKLCPAPPVIEFPQALGPGPGASFRERIRPDLELHQLARRSLAAFDVKRRARRVGAPDAFPLPSRLHIVNAPVHPFRVKTHRVWNAERQELAVNEREQ